MPDGLFTVIGLLVLGYIMLLLEVFLPGGVLGVLGLVSVGWGCFKAFSMGTYWGSAALGASILVAFVVVKLFLRSRTAKNLVLDQQNPDWQAPDSGLVALVGKAGRTITPLRPAGLAEIDEQRMDVVADSEFIDAGVLVRVCEVEGNRVVVEAEPAGSY